MFRPKSQQQTKRLRVAFLFALLIDWAFFFIASVLGWISYQRTLDGEIQDERSQYLQPSKEIILTCASIGTIGVLLIPIWIIKSLSKIRSKETLIVSRGTPLTRKWSLAGFVFSLVCLLVLIGITYRSHK